MTTQKLAESIAVGIVVGIALAVLGAYVRRRLAAAPVRNAAWAPHSPMDNGGYGAGNIDWGV